MSVNQTSFKDEIKGYCKGVACDVENYASGEVYKCPNCCEIIESPEDAICPNCKEELSINDQLSLYDYFEDALDIEYRVGSNKDYRSVCIMVTCGGPNVYIDTEDAKADSKDSSDTSDSSKSSSTAASTSDKEAEVEEGFVYGAEGE